MESWCVAWRPPQFRSPTPGLQPIAAQQPKDAGWSRRPSTWPPSSCTPTNAQFVFRIPWNSLRAPLESAQLCFHSHLSAGWERQAKEGVSVSLTGFLRSQRSAHAEFARRKGILSGSTAACFLVLKAPSEGPVINSHEWPSGENRFGSVGRKERKRLCRIWQDALVGRCTSQFPNPAFYNVDGDKSRKVAGQSGS